MTGVGESERYRSLVEASTDIIAVVDADGTVTYVNRAVERILGYEPAKLIGDDVAEYAHPDDRETVRETIEALRTEPNETRTVELRLRRADGSWCWIEALVQNRLDNDVVGGILVNGRDVTERKERERELVTTKQRMELALEGANLGIWDWNMRTGEVSRDELLTEMLGYTQAEMGDRMRGWERVVHPADRERHDEALAEHVAARTPYYRCDHRLKTNSGDWKWVRTMGKVVERDEDGEPVRAVGIHQDIDDRKRAELALEEERDMFKEGPAVVFKWEDTDGWPIEYVSENVEEVLGYMPDELQSGEIQYLEIIHEGDRERIVEEASELDSEGTDRITLDPYRVATASGDIRWVKEYTRAIESGSDPDQLLGYLVDITERKRRENELRQFKAAVERSAHAIYITDVDGTIEYVNPAFEEITGYSEERAVGETPRILQSGEYDDEFYAAFWETIRSGEQWQAEITDERADDERIVLNQTVAPIIGDDGAVRKFVAVAQDTTARKEYEQQLEEQRDNLDILNRVLRHDIRNDLQLITAYTKMVSDECDDPETDEYLTTVLESADHAVELTKVAREMADVMLSANEESRPVDLRNVLQSELDEVRSTYSRAVVSTETGIPRTTVEANEMLNSVFRNLLKNAIQHNDAATPQVRISIMEDDDAVVVRIADNGPGIPDAQRKTIFGKGEKGLDSQGTGIGLYLVDTLVESYGGDVWVEDSDAGGAAFVVELPKVE